jgi:anti-sigma B factor antagonist
VRAIGEIDVYTARLFERALAPATGTAPAVIVVDLHGVTFLGTAGMLILARARDRARREGTRLHVLSSTPAVDRALSLVDEVLAEAADQSSRSKI